MSSELSLLHGPSTPPLLSKPLGTLIDEQAVQFGDRTAVVVSWQQARLSYRQLADRSKLVAKALLETGLKPGDHVGIMAGNRYEYIEVFLGAARIGCPVVLHNLTWSASQLQSAAKRGGMLTHP
jgi:acyl-CoA synthetase (AMP-forming)/AMP-acid ligase II